MNLKIHGFEGRRGGKRGCHYDVLGLFAEKVAILFGSGAKVKKMEPKWSQSSFFSGLFRIFSFGLFEMVSDFFLTSFGLSETEKSMPYRLECAL